MAKRKRSDWLNKFNRAVSNLEKRARKNPKIDDGRKDPDWYEFNQDKLSILKKTGRGNCVAWTLFAVELAKSCGLKAIYIILWDRYKKDKYRHRVSLVYDRDGTVWYQSCKYVNRLCKNKGREKFSDTKRKLCRAAARDCKWKQGSIVDDMWMG